MAHPFLTHIGPGFAAFLVILIIWSLIWKGLALWRAARNHQTAWYVIMLIVNTAGILEIVYLAFFRKDQNHLAGSAQTPSQTPPPASNSDASSN